MMQCKAALERAAFLFVSFCKSLASVSNVLPRLLQLQAKPYHYKDNHEGACLSYGFIAQEAELLFLKFVSANCRLKQKDMNGAITYSVVRTVHGKTKRIRCVCPLPAFILCD